MSKASSFRPRNRLHLAALAILITGLVAAVAVYIVAARPATDASNVQIINGQAYPVDSSHEMQQLARLGGTASVQTFKFQRWFASLWEGQQLAYALLIVSAALALLCWHIAGLMDETA